MKKAQHVSDDVLVRLLDDELPQEEAVAAQTHVELCTECGKRYADLRDASNQFDGFAGAIEVPFSESERNTLALLLNTQRDVSQPPKRAQYFGWAIAIAASLIIGLLIAPRFWHGEVGATNTAAARQPASLLDVDGESFIALPYSNPDLPVPTHRIVRMQVPVSSLIDAGVHFEAISNEAVSRDESVLADVLLGIDGQPLGVHVLGSSN
jgi:hypothetical protein